MEKAVLETPEHGPQEEHIVVSLNSNPAMEEQHTYVSGKDIDSDHLYDPKSEELNTDYSSDEENLVRYPMFNEEKKLWDPQFEVRKTFRDILQFRKAIKNHGVACGAI
ncbi:Uncharacterized protein Adt_36175 [Abeliophyllum distichum]|uniref:Uncharacterized protein n=1 Tax=Abeliophyllum distichum TaxID=126358 RepID=A0ABD1QHR2_9LAMI